MTAFEQQKGKIRDGNGFIAALDQSGGSTPKALKAYGVDESAYGNDTEMFDVIHAMRTRIMTDGAFTGERVIGAILFENTMDRQVEGQPTSKYLWHEKQVVPFLKVDKGLHDEANGVQMMKDIPGLGDLLARAKALDVFGTKMRSVIKSANEEGIKAIVAQQFEVGKEISTHGLVPIIEPEVDINSATKAECETILKASIGEHLDQLSDDQDVMLKLTLPSADNFYKECIDHPRCVKVVALSGGYSREDANSMLGRNAGMIASFSRGLTEGLSAQQSDDEFHAMLDGSIESIYRASIS
jgi:fructose-bisphosphate aldolase class I